MKKISGLIVLMIALCAFAAAQRRLYELATKDSLEKLLAVSKPDTNLVMLYSELAIRHMRSNHDSSTMYARKGIELARKLKFRKGEADCLRRSGLVYFHQGRYPEALDIFQKALRISQDENYPFGISAGLGHIGNIYSMQGNYAEARAYYLKRLKISEGSQSMTEKESALGNIARSYLKQGYLDSALYYFNQVPVIYTNVDDPRLPDIWTDMGKVHTQLGNTAIAKDFFRKSIAMSGPVNNLITLCEGNLGMADLFLRANQADSCIYYAKQGLAAGQQTKYFKGILSASELLSKAYEATDEHQAFSYHKMATAIKDSLFNTEKAAQVQNLFFVEQQRQQAADAANTRYKNQLKLYALLGAVLLFLVLAIIFWRNNRLRQRAYLLLQNQKLETDQQKQKVEQALEDLKSAQSLLVQAEKMASLGELTAGIAHEIQNPLNFVNNFSEVNKELIDELKGEKLKVQNERDEKLENELLTTISENLDKINHHGKRADAIVKGMLQHSRSSSLVKEPTDINNLVTEYLRLAYHGLRARDKSFSATFKTDYDEHIGSVDIIPQDIGRALLNLINNAFYAVDEKKKKSGNGYEPTVTVTTRRMSGKAEIKVADNGNGIPHNIIDKIFQPFFTTKPTGQGTGLGLSLSYDIVKAHGGDIKVIPGKNEGAEFIIQIPLKTGEN